MNFLFHCPRCLNTSLGFHTLYDWLFKLYRFFNRLPFLYACSFSNKNLMKKWDANIHCSVELKKQVLPRFYKPKTELLICTLFTWFFSSSLDSWPRASLNEIINSVNNYWLASYSFYYLSVSVGNSKYSSTKQSHSSHHIYNVDKLTVK